MCSCCSGYHGTALWNSFPKSPGYPSHAAAGTQFWSGYLWTPPALSSAGRAVLQLRWGLVFLQRFHHVVILRQRQRSLNVPRKNNDVVLHARGKGCQIYMSVALSVPISFPKEIIKDLRLFLFFCSQCWIPMSWILTLDIFLCLKPLQLSFLCSSLSQIAAPGLDSCKLNVLN